MAFNNPSQEQQKQGVWGWTNSINTFVENTKTASESFFDNVAATLAKKNEQQQQQHHTQPNIHNNNNANNTNCTNTTNTTNNTNLQCKKPSFHQQSDEKLQQSDDPYIVIKSELEQWKSKYTQLKTAQNIKTAMLQNELQKYKDTELSFNRHISLEKESKIAKLESQINKYQQNEKQCMNILKENIRKYHQNTDYLQHQIDNKYKIFYEKLLNVTVKAGLNPNHIFTINDTNNKSIQKLVNQYQNIKNNETMSVVSDFEEKEHIHNAEEHIENINLKTDEITNIHLKPNKTDKNVTIKYELDNVKYEQTIVELNHKLKEYESSLDEYRDKYLHTVEKYNILEQKNIECNDVCHELNDKWTQLSTERMKEKGEYNELQTLFESMSDQNTDFQQQIKDVHGENELLRQQFNQYKLQHQSDMDELVLQNGTLKESLKELQLKYDEMSNKLNEEYEMSEQLREQIKQTSKISNKRHKSNTKLKKKMETLEKKSKELEYITAEQNKKLKRYSEKITDLESNENKYNNAIASYKSLQHEIEEYIQESNEYKTKIYNVESEILINKQHSDELRKQSNRDRKNISRLTNCNDELINIIQQCEDILIKSAHKYLPISIINDQELELSDSDDEYNAILVSNDDNMDMDDCKKNNNLIYFDDSDSDDTLNKIIKKAQKEEDDDDDIFKVCKENDIKALQLGARLKIQVSVLSEQLKKFQDKINNYKHELYRKEEETLQQQYELRQIAMRRRLQQQVKKELSKRERNMVSIASVRGLNMRHKTSLANLTQMQDKVNRIVNDIEENDELWKSNISMQLSGNTKSSSMKSSSMDLLLLDSNNIMNSPMSTSSMKRNRPLLSDNDILETQSMHSLSSGVSGHSKKSINSQSMSLTTHNRNRNRKQKYKQKVRSLKMQPMQTMQSMQSQKDNNKTKQNQMKRKKSFASKWFK